MLSATSGVCLLGVSADSKRNRQAEALPAYKWFRF